MVAMRMPLQNSGKIDSRNRRSPRLARLTVNAARCAAIAIAAIAIGTLAGWALDVPVLRRVMANAVEMKANTATALLLLAVALFLLGNLASLSARRWRRFARALAALAGLVGAATLGEYAFGWELAIDEFFFATMPMPITWCAGACRPTVRWRWCAPPLPW